jgi:hypothetical protein
MFKQIFQHPLVMSRRCCLLAVLPFFLVSTAHALQVTAVTAKAEPAKYKGLCPFTVVFSGTITVDGPGTVTYRWEHSPGTGTAQQISFDQAGTQTVSLARTLDYSDFLELVTLSPNTEIAHASFTATCTGFKPDLTVTARTTANPLQPSPGLKVNVVNIGKGAYQPPPATRVVARDRKGTVIGTATLSQAIPGNGGTVQVTIQPVKTIPWQAARDRLTIEVDDLKLIDEVKEDNNTIVIGK